MKALVTGHRGFVGAHLWAALDALGYELTGLDLKDGQDILTAELPAVDKVFHLAAQTDAQSFNAEADARTNIMGTLRLLEKYGSRLIFASSAAVNYPVTPYAISKRACEEYVRMYGAASVRFCNLYGEGGHSVIDRFRHGDCMEIRGTGTQRRTYAPVEDAVAALMDANPGVLTILPGKDMTVNDVAAMYQGKRIVHVPALQTDLIEGRQRAA